MDNMLHGNSWAEKVPPNSTNSFWGYILNVISACLFMYKPLIIQTGV